MGRLWCSRSDFFFWRVGGGEGLGDAVEGGGVGGIDGLESAGRSVEGVDCRSGPVDEVGGEGDGAGLSGEAG